MGELIEGNQSDLAALERFIVDNDDLLALEERIGRFNIFDALGIARAEIRHSNFLAWLLDPIESHGQGSLFLKAVLMDLLKHARANGFDVPISPIELDGEELRGVEIRRERNNIDLLIKSDEPRFVIAIENKIDSGEHSNQLQRYENTVAAEFADWKAMFVFLTTDSSAASDEGWVPYSYADIHRVLERAHRTNAGAIGHDVVAFLEHYLRTIRSKFMEDKEIDDLCRKIFRTHRQALDLIYERVGSPELVTYREIQEFVKTEMPSWTLVHRGKKETVIALKPWIECFPSIGTWYSLPQAWIVLNFWPQEHGLYFRLYACPTSDSDLRRKIIGRLIDNPKEFGLRSKIKTFREKWATLASGDLAKWTAAEEADLDQIKSAVRTKLDEIAKRLASAPAALQPIFEDWKMSQAGTTQL